MAIRRQKGCRDKSVEKKDDARSYIVLIQIDDEYRVALFTPALISVGDHGETPQMAREHPLRT